MDGGAAWSGRKLVVFLAPVFVSAAFMSLACFALLEGDASGELKVVSPLLTKYSEHERLHRKEGPSTQQLNTQFVGTRAPSEGKAVSVSADPEGGVERATIPPPAMPRKIVSGHEIAGNSAKVELSPEERKRKNEETLRKLSRMQPLLEKLPGMHTLKRFRLEREEAARLKEEAELKASEGELADEGLEPPLAMGGSSDR